MRITRLSDQQTFTESQHDLAVLIAQDEDARGYNWNNRWDLQYHYGQWHVVNASGKYEFWLDPKRYSVRTD